MSEYLTNIKEILERIERDEAHALEKAAEAESVAARYVLPSLPFAADINRKG